MKRRPVASSDTSRPRKTAKFRRRNHPHGFRPHLECLEDRLCLSPVNQFDIIAKTGQGGLEDIYWASSINDSGTVAFVGNTDQGQAIFVGNKSGDLRTITAPTEWNYAPPLQINNSNQVVGLKSWTGLNRPSEAIMVWDAAVPNEKYEVMAQNQGAPRQFDVLDAYTSISNEGLVAYAGRGVSSEWEVQISPTGLGVNLGTTVGTLYRDPYFSAMAADGGRVVVGWSDDADTQIEIFDILGLDLKETIATTKGGVWSELGYCPGVSDDGKIVAFYGELTEKGAGTLNTDQLPFGLPKLYKGSGVFVSINTEHGWAILRIAGKTANGCPDPGEKWVWNEKLQKKTDQFGFSDFDSFINERVSVERTLSVPNEEDSARVVFKAKDAKDANNKEGIFTARFSVSKPEILAAPTPIVLVGSDTTDIGLGSLTDLEVWDSTNSANQVAFCASAGKEDAVVRATRNLDPLRQFASPWGEQDYAPKELQDYINTLDSKDPQRKRLVELQASHRNNLAAKGCTLTAYAMALRQLGIADINPGELHDQLQQLEKPKSEGGKGIQAFTKIKSILKWPDDGLPTFDGADLNPAAVQALYPSLRQRDANLDQVMAALKDGPALLKLSMGSHGQHWVLATGLDSEGKVQIIDPGSQWNDKAYTKQELQTDKKFAQGRILRVDDASAATFRTGCPVEVLIVSPSGMRLGIDTRTGLSYAEIPNSSYGEEFPVLNPDEELTPAELAAVNSDLPRVAFINSLEEGPYTIQVFGTGDGPFTLDFAWGGGSMPYSAIHTGGLISAGEVLTYTVDTTHPTDPPLAQDDSAVTHEGAGVDIDVLANDSDPDGSLDLASVVVTTRPAHGTTLVSPTTGIINYMPKLGYAGTDTFRYTVKDDLGAVSAEAIVTVKVWGANDPPDALDDCVATSQGVAVAIDVLANDRDGENSLDPATVVVVSPPGHGTATVEPTTGLVIYTPAAGYAGPDSFGYTVRNGKRQVSNEATVMVSIGRVAAYGYKTWLTSFDSDQRGEQFGSCMAADGDLLVVGAPEFGQSAWSLGGKDLGGKVYVFQRNDQETPGDSSDDTWELQARLSASDATEDDWFGQSVAISGDTIVVGAERAYSDDISGAAYVFQRNGETWIEQQKLVPADLEENDWFGNSVAISSNTIFVGAPSTRQSGSVYVFSRIGTAWAEQQKLKVNDAALDDFFGVSMAVSGKTLVVGAPGDDERGSNFGAAYVFRQSNTTWTLDKQLTATDAAFGANFGSVVSIDGETIVVTTRHVVYLFEQSAGDWVQQQKLTAASATWSDCFGDSVAITGDTLVVGAPGTGDEFGAYSSGAAYVYRRIGGLWVEQRKLKASDAAHSDVFGSSVVISGETLLVGAPGDDDGGSYPGDGDSSREAGSAYVFTRGDDGWTELSKLERDPRYIEAPSVYAYNGYSVAMDGDFMVVATPYRKRYFSSGWSPGAAYVFQRNSQGTPNDPSDDTWDPFARLTSDEFAQGGQVSVAISGDTIVIGAELDCEWGELWYAGAAHVFRYNGSTWTEEQKLTASDAGFGYRFGCSVAISGDTIVVGAEEDGDRYASGSAYVFRRSGSIWAEEQKLTPSDAREGDEFGGAVAISGDTVVVGAAWYWTDDPAGAVYVFERSGGTWNQIQKLTSSDPAEGDRFGMAVLISGDTIIAGSPWDTDSGGHPGSAYIFSRNGNTWSQQQMLTASDAVTSDLFGCSLAISGDTLVVGASGAEPSGAAYVFSRGPDAWTEKQKLARYDAYLTMTRAETGFSVAVCDDTIVTGAPFVNVFFGEDTYWEDTVWEAGVAFVFGPAPPPLVAIAALDSHKAEGNSGTTEYTFTVSRSGDSSGTATLHYAITGAGDSPADAADFGGTLPAGNVTFQPGETSQTVTVLINGDLMEEDDEQFAVILTDPAGSVAITAAFATATILNDDVCYHFQDKLLPGDLLQGGEHVGYSVSVDGDWMVVGAPAQDVVAADAGAAYVFRRSQQGTPDDASDDLWQWLATLVADDGETGDRFGASVTVSGDWVVIGSPGDDDRGTDAGSAYVFHRSGNKWSQQGKLIASDAAENDQFGTSVAVAGNWIAVGAPYRDDAGSNSGAVYLFGNTGSGWTETHKLAASNETEGDCFGASAAISGDWIVVGAPLGDTGGWDSGSAYIFHFDGENWWERQALNANDAAYQDSFGVSLAIQGGTIVVGALYGDSATPDAGSAYVFCRNDQGTPEYLEDDIWDWQATLAASDAEGDDRFGASVAIDGSTIIVGAPGDEISGSPGTTAIDAGSAYVFRRAGTEWLESQKLTAPDAAEGDQFGFSVGISADSIVIGAPWYDSLDDSGNPLVDVGSTYVFGPTRSPILFISALDAHKAEGSQDTFAHTFTVRRLGDLSSATTVHYAVTGSGTSPADADDFGGTLPSGTVTFQANEASQTITVWVAGDTLVEAVDGYTVRLSNASGRARIATANASGAIDNDDTAVLSISDVTAMEGNGGSTVLQFSVVLSRAVQGGLRVPFTVLDGTATAADDFTVVNASPLIFSGVAGETQTITVQVNADRKLEDDEQFQVQLGTPGILRTGILAGNITVDDSSATGTILNDDEDYIVVDLGHVDFRRLEGLNPGAGELWFRLETARDGWLTVQSVAQWTADRLTIRLFDPNDLNQPLAVSNASDSMPRIDHAAEEGQILLLKVTGSASDVSLLVANLVHEAGGIVTVYGTDQDDEFIFDAADSREVTINGVTYHYEDTEVSTVNFDGGSGTDLVWLYDSAGNENLEAWPGRVVFANRSGDSEQDYSVEAVGFEHMLAYATRGGSDSAILHGSEGSDKFKSYEDYVRLRAMNSIYSLRAKQFDSIVGDSGAAGRDVAVFNGTDGNETFTYSGGNNSARVQGKNRDHLAQGFISITVYGGGGQGDVAHFTDVPGPQGRTDDVLYFRSHKTQLVGQDVKVTARAFDEVHATASESGFDVARVYDTTGDDHLEIDGDTARLYRQNGDELDLLYEAVAFERVKAYRSEGNDTKNVRPHSIDLLLYGWDQ